MILFYNLIQLTILFLLFPLLLTVVLIREKYRARIPKRLGLGLGRLSEKITTGHPRIWIHALSVGEVASSVSLVKAIKKDFPSAVLLFSTSTSSGEKFAKGLVDFPVDFFVPFPLDLYPVTEFFIKKLRPDLFVLVETDFWPNFICGLHRKNIPSLLVNGRISKESYTRYRFFQPFFLQVFNSFSFLSMQRQEDVKKIAGLGLPRDKIVQLGNLKYDSVLPGQKIHDLPNRREFGINEECFLCIAGSTHPGEEEIICSVFKRLLSEIPSLFLVIAPRNIERSAVVRAVVFEAGLSVSLRSSGKGDNDNVLVLDTMGELAGFYSMADAALIGGSFVNEGGHNPLEPAVFAKPVLFGPHMEDFADVVEDMVAESAGFQAHSIDDLYSYLRLLIRNKEERQRAGLSAGKFIEARQGVANRHIDFIRQVLQ